MQDVPFSTVVKDGRGTVGLAVPKTNWANTIDKPPFQAYAVTCGVTFTFGGVKISNEGNVQNLSHDNIPGLFAAGEMVGGLFYFNYPSGSGLVAGAVFGRLAGTSAARHVRGGCSTSVAAGRSRTLLGPSTRYSMGVAFGCA